MNFKTVFAGATAMAFAGIFSLVGCGAGDACQAYVDAVTAKASSCIKTTATATTATATTTTAPAATCTAAQAAVATCAKACIDAVTCDGLTGKDAANQKTYTDCIVKAASCK